MADPCPGAPNIGIYTFTSATGRIYRELSRRSDSRDIEQISMTNSKSCAEETREKKFQSRYTSRARSRIKVRGVTRLAERLVERNDGGREEREQAPSASAAGSTSAQRGAHRSEEILLWDEESSAAVAARTLPRSQLSSPFAQSLDVITNS